MRFIRIGDHLVNVAEACYIHFGKGAHVDIVFNDRVLSGNVSEDTSRRLGSMANDAFVDEPEDGLKGVFMQDFPEQRLIDAATRAACRETGVWPVGQDLDDIMLLAKAWMREHGLD